MKYFVEFEDSIAGYSSRRFQPDEMCDIGNFFSGDYRVFKKFDFVDDWLNDPTQHCISGNLIYLEKKDGMIFFGDLLGEDDQERIGLTIEAFKKLLDDWEKVVQQKPKKIIITKEGDEITVESKS